MNARYLRLSCRTQKRAPFLRDGVSARYAAQLPLMDSPLATGPGSSIASLPAPDQYPRSPLMGAARSNAIPAARASESIRDARRRYGVVKRSRRKRAGPIGEAEPRAGCVATGTLGCVTVRNPRRLSARGGSAQSSPFDDRSKARAFFAFSRFSSVNQSPSRG